ncbi:MAG: ISAzo13 family transposase, partial [Proteobacteria bacterium]|nr:ISAzo13 family transposase [Pseudomonadota bacterium]
EAIKLPHGGTSYIASLFGCARKTIAQGIKELDNPEQIEKERIRKKGGGRKPSLESISGIDEFFLLALHDHTAGDPMDHKIRWTHLTHQQIADLLKEHGIEISRKIVKQLFKKHGCVKRKAQKSLSTGSSKDRNEQFEIIGELIARYKSAGNPVISIDTKKKEVLGNLYRAGLVYTLEFQKVFDHDFPHLAEGILIPHGIFDVLKNKAHVNIGTSKDTSEFSCDSIRAWWYSRGIIDYSGSNALLILCDAGGSNSYRHYIFKEDLQKLADE